MFFDGKQVYLGVRVGTVHLLRLTTRSSLQVCEIVGHTYSM